MYIILLYWDEYMSLDENLFELFPLSFIFFLFFKWFFYISLFFLIKNDFFLKHIYGSKWIFWEWIELQMWKCRWCQRWNRGLGPKQQKHQQQNTQIYVISFTSSSCYFFLFFFSSISLSLTLCWRRICALIYHLNTLYRKTRRVCEKK